jgi:hypothetical protein
MAAKDDNSPTSLETAERHARAITEHWRMLGHEVEVQFVPTKTRWGMSYSARLVTEVAPAPRRMMGR